MRREGRDLLVRQATRDKLHDGVFPLAVFVCLQGYHEVVVGPAGDRGDALGATVRPMTGGAFAREIGAVVGVARDGEELRVEAVLLGGRRSAPRADGWTRDRKRRAAMRAGPRGRSRPPCPRSSCASAARGPAGRRGTRRGSPRSRRDRRTLPRAWPESTGSLRASRPCGRRGRSSAGRSGAPRCLPPGGSACTRRRAPGHAPHPRSGRRRPGKAPAALRRSAREPHAPNARASGHGVAESCWRGGASDAPGIRRAPGSAGFQPARTAEGIPKSARARCPRSQEAGATNLSVVRNQEPLCKFVSSAR